LSSRFLPKNVYIKIYKTLISPEVPYGCKLGVSNFKKRKWTGVFENRVRRGTSGSKRDKLTGGWRKLHNERIHNLYSSPNDIKIMKAWRTRWAGHVASMGGWRTE
jgi:hypothetical protein